jgi:hypothetical protein
MSVDHGRKRWGGVVLGAGAMGATATDTLRGIDNRPDAEPILHAPGSICHR